jgi:hypothetical protein
VRTIDVACPRCGAKPGVLCDGMSRGIMASTVTWHGERVAAAGTDRELTDDERRALDAMGGRS